MGTVVNESAQKKNLVYSSVFADIVRNKYDISSIITEKMIIDAYGVSKSPVREALQELCVDGILESIPRLGYRVRPVSIKEMLNASDFRIIIELSALDKSFPGLTEEKMKGLEDIYSKELDILNTHDPYLHWDYNIRFHTLLCSYSDNPFFGRTLKTLMKSCFHGVNYYYSQSFSKNLRKEDSKHHYLILEALKERDKEKTKKALISDIEDFKADFAPNSVF